MLVLLGSMWVATAADAEPTKAPPAAKTRKAMDNAALNALLLRIDADARKADNVWELTVQGVPITVITDERADRMRIMAPIIETTQMPPELAARLLQANFDSALDARYAIARGIVWSAYIHPLSPLTETQLFSAVAQVVNLVGSFGTSYSSGALVFGGGDSNDLQLELYRKMMGLVEEI